MKASELQKVLELVKPGLAGSEVLEQSTSFAFIPNYVCTYNDEVSVRVPVDLTQLQGAVEADKLYAYLKTLGEETIGVKEKDSTLFIKTRKGKAQFGMEKKIVLPIFFEFSEKWYKIDNVKKFKKALQFCGISTATDFTHPILTNVFIGQGIVQSSDGFRITSVDVEHGIDKELLLPYANVRALLHYNFVEYQFSDNWVHFRDGDGLIFSIRLYKAKWVDVNQYLGLENTKKIQLPENLSEYVTRASIFTVGSYSPYVYLRFEEGVIIIHSEAETAKYEEKIKVDHGIDFDLQIAVNPTFLQNILKEDFVECYLIKDRFIRFVSKEWMHLVSLVKQNNDAV